jgi:hypothetical protein
MYRAVVLITLVVLLLAVAGVSVAQEGRIFAGEPNGDDSPESTAPTTPEQTSLEATGSEEITMSTPPGASSETEDQQNTPETTVVTEPTVVTDPTVQEPEKPTAAPVREEAPAPVTNGVSNPGDSGRAVGKPAHAVKASDPTAGAAEIGQHGKREPAELENEGEPGRGLGEQKAILCHKGDKTLTVGVPALAAHLRHGDTRGACQGVSGSEPAGETVGSEAATNGENGGGGRDKVVVCHKNKSLTVGAPARAAHLRHGDSLGACP